MSRFKGLKFSSLSVVLFFALPAFAQFEVSPDHFDPANNTARATAHKKSVSRPSASAASSDHRKNGGPTLRTNPNAYRKEKPKRQVATGTWPRRRDEAPATH